ncbi:MAG: hypothetical protein JWQ87_3530 [Candidatus Sulfotelmatobacter sp.]|nr:hypothetical protein [Candidatus Sulfotelmatobacter sp.]
MNTLFGNTAGLLIAAPKKKYSLLPVLTVLFVISYGLMTMLIVEQGSVIQSQRNVIKVLSADNTELAAIMGRAVGDKQMVKAPAQTPSAHVPAQTLSGLAAKAQAPKAQVPSAQLPSAGMPQQQHAPSRPGKIAKPGAQAPPVPAADLVDHRRALLTI